ncbi:caspase family protein [Streptomyces sp. NPDC053560]|uniref:VMAP-C domain-containing protein n=1 Tax=Streptomyces sp. NPDC053560 TaxID=3365711 RepID=UPI0037CFF8C1
MKGPHHGSAPVHDWRRTHAVLVAVEEYEGGLEWELDGPVRDALGMRAWLLDQGVPQDNIQLLASPLARNAGTLAAAPAYRPADRTTLRRVFRDELRTLDGEWLWIYWAGHGVQAQGDRWSLLYPEARGDDLLGVDAENLIHLLRTDRLPQRGVGRVTVVVDACRKALPGRQQSLAAAPERFSEEAQTCHDRRVFQMRAARPGGVAKNRDETGLFTSVLLRQLRAAVRDGAPVDLDHVWEAVRAEFERLRTEERIQQFPTLHVSNWDDEARDVSFTLPLRGARHRQQLVFEVGRLLAAQAGLAETAAATLCRELDAPPPVTASPSAEELVDWALVDPHGVATLLDTLTRQSPEQPLQIDAHAARRILQPGRWLTAAEHTALLELLGRMGSEDLRRFAGTAREEVPGLPALEPAPAPLADGLEGLSCSPQRLPQLLRVIERFVARQPEAQPAAALRDWSLGCANRIGLAAALLDRRAEAEESATASQPVDPAGADDRIQVRLRPPDGPGQLRRYEVWSRRGTDVEALATVDAPASAGEIQRDLDDLLNLHARTQETLVEFFLAATDLELGVHRWQRGLSGPVERSLGTDFPVVVRCTDLREANQRHLWQRRWARVDGASTEDLHWLPDHLEKSRQVYGALQERESAPGVVVTTPRRARSEVFNACLYGGVPVLIWHSEAERAPAREQLKDLIGREKLRLLPHHLRKLRSASDADDHHPGRNLALLWDDPQHPLPGKLHLSAP